MRITAYKQSSLHYARALKKSFEAVLAFRPRFLNWRARDVAIGAKHAAIAFPGLEANPAPLTHVEKQACVRRHGL